MRFMLGEPLSVIVENHFQAIKKHVNLPRIQVWAIIKTSYVVLLFKRREAIYVTNFIS